VKVLSYSDKLYQLIPSPKVVEKKKSSSNKSSFELKEGI
jgi:ribosomal protein S1